ncbi:sulfite exporter TauE/SafE family protein [Ilumatobacter sp.]|uniref:sulfite exporter TauE/SafE family protein n=1 Tax=Ilumatobacter sp. TaxID=1967498 RepID=UPI003C685D85
MNGDVIAVVLGLLVGLSLGALGGGGSTLAVPILVFVAGLDAQAATTASLLVVGVAAAIGAVQHRRNGNVRLGVGVAFGLAGIVGSRIGTLVNRAIADQILLLAFAVLIMFVAVRMYRSAGRGPSQPSVVATPVGSGSAGGTAGVDTMERVARPTMVWSARAVLELAGAATAVGMLTGLFGVGGGFAVVPALTLLLKFPTRVAIGTSLVVIAVNAAIALGMRSGDLDLDWGVVVPFLTTVTVGVLVGTRVARGIDADRLTRGFALMLAAVATYTAMSTVLGA